MAIILLLLPRMVELAYILEDYDMSDYERLGGLFTVLAMQFAFYVIFRRVRFGSGDCWKSLEFVADFVCPAFLAAPKTSR